MRDVKQTEPNILVFGSVRRFYPGRDFILESMYHFKQQLSITLNSLFSLRPVHLVTEIWRFVCQRISTVFWHVIHHSAFHLVNFHGESFFGLIFSCIVLLAAANFIRSLYIFHLQKSLSRDTLHPDSFNLYFLFCKRYVIIAFPDRFKM